MKVTVVKIVTPIDVVTKHANLNLTQREEKAVLFFDPWNHPGSEEWNRMVTKLNRHMAEIMNQDNATVCVKYDLIYTINGVGHFRDETIPIIDELRNYHYTDAATYAGIVDGYCQGRQVEFVKYKACQNTKLKADRFVEKYNKSHAFRVVHNNR